MATLTLTIFCILLIICIATNHFILYALFAGLVFLASTAENRAIHGNL